MEKEDEKGKVREEFEQEGRKEGKIVEKEKMKGKTRTR